jgi:hypothetical protein
MDAKVCHVGYNIVLAGTMWAPSQPHGSIILSIYSELIFKFASVTLTYVWGTKIIAEQPL